MKSRSGKNGKPSVCSIQGCERSYKASGYCNKHYMQIRRHGRPTPERELGRKQTCSVKGCDKLHKAHGYCNKHYRQIKKHGKLVPEHELHRWDSCRASGCTHPPKAKGYCDKHYKQIANHGRLTPERELGRSLGQQRNNTDRLATTTSDPFSQLFDKKIFGDHSEWKEDFFIGDLPTDCDIFDCEEPHFSGGVCHFHYIRSWPRRQLEMGVGAARKNNLIPAIDFDKG